MFPIPGYDGDSAGWRRQSINQIVQIGKVSPNPGRGNLPSSGHTVQSQTRSTQQTADNNNKHRQ